MRPNRFAGFGWHSVNFLKGTARDGGREVGQSVGEVGSGMLALPDTVDGAPIGANKGCDLASAVPVEDGHDEAVEVVASGIAVLVEDIAEVGD